jgi:sugar fermentation stimulation protein A
LVLQRAFAGSLFLGYGFLAMINFSEPRCYGRLIKRYKRFFMDIELDSGELVTAHAPNTGSMIGLLEPNSPVMLTASNDKKRSTSHTVQGIKVGGAWVGINTHLPNKLIKSSLHHPLLHDLLSYQQYKSEVPYGVDSRSRVDFRFFDANDGRPDLYLEIKNVTLKVGDYAQFPDAVSVRALKHLEDLMYVVSLGFRAGLLFVVQRPDCPAFMPANSIDPHYAQMLAHARANGVAIRALCAKLTDEGLVLTHEIPCVF